VSVENDIQAASAQLKASGSVAGIVSIRFVAALWVAFSHGARFPLEAFFVKHYGRVSLISDQFFCGIMAVVVFFIISGFCIHYPNVNKTSFEARPFLIRRIVRIGIPLAVIVWVSKLLGQSYVDAEDAVLWTIYCEIVYYSIYPLLLALFKHVSIHQAIIGSAVCSGILVLCRPRALYLWQMGAWTWLYCLPFWLAGALMAERFKRGHIPRKWSIWMWRIPPLIYGVLASDLTTDSRLTVGLVWTMPPFAIYSYLWIRREIEYLGRRPSKILEALGLASYSTYLVHPIAIHFFQSHLHPGRTVAWISLILIITFATATFYFVVEKPSHDLARFLGRRSR
jgi:peptidoglycan/LPS O-acetylase OafA/YrhL